MLVWHAQDARAYTLLALLLAGTIAALAAERLWWWAGLATAALATHHFAVFVVAPEAVWLLLHARAAAWRFVAVAGGGAHPAGRARRRAAGDRSSWIAGSA